MINMSKALIYILPFLSVTISSHTKVIKLWLNNQIAQCFFGNMNILNSTSYEIVDAYYDRRHNLFVFHAPLFGSDI